MNKKNVLLSCLVLVAGLGLQGCAGSSKATTADSGNTDCNRAQAGTATLGLKTQKASTVSGNNLPRTYTVFKATGEKAFFMAAKKQNGTAAFQLPSGCRQFRVSLSETMSPQLMERYPDLVSLKGTSEEGADLRLDWDGTSMRGQIVENGKSFFLEPHNSGNGNVYLFFNKDEATTPRRAFETTSPSQNTNQQRVRDAEK